MNNASRKPFAFEPIDARSVRGRADAALTTYGLASLIGFRSQNAAADAPYHNSYHADCVLVQCSEAIHFYSGLGTTINAFRLLIAAFFHDFDHTAGEEQDAVNIERAGHALMRLLSASVSKTTEREVEEIFALIRSTQYPFSATDPPALEARVLRDADLMQVFESDVEKRFRQYDGLRLEIQRQRGHDVSRTEFAIGMREWWREHTRWLSAWGAARANTLDYMKRSEETARSMETLDSLCPEESNLISSQGHAISLGLSRK